MKWIFAILVALNLIVFGAQIVQKMTFRPGSSQNQISVSDLNHLKADSDDMQVLSLNNQSDDDTYRDDRRQRMSRDSSRDSQRGFPTPERPVQTQSLENTSAPAPQQQPPAPAPTRENCNTAIVELPETVYHRIKGLINQYQNVASRNIVKNPAAMGSTTQFMVVVQARANDNNLLTQLREKDLMPQIINGKVVVGTFNNRRAASHIQATVTSYGFKTSIQERTVGPQKDQPLSMVIYRVTFSNVNDVTAREIEGIVGPYAPLQRISCH